MSCLSPVLPVFFTSVVAVYCARAGMEARDNASTSSAASEKLWRDARYIAETLLFKQRVTAAWTGTECYPGAGGGLVRRKSAICKILVTDPGGAVAFRAGASDPQ